jgi:MFS family permease
VASLTTARLAERYGRLVIAAGALMQAAGLALLAATLDSAWPNVDALVLAPAMIVAGFGQGLIVAPLFGFVLSGVPAARAGVGSGILTTTTQAALALGVATLGSLFLSVNGAGSLGMSDAFVTVLGIQTAMTLIVAAAAWGLPRPRARQASRPAPVSIEREYAEEAA